MLNSGCADPDPTTVNLCVPDPDTNIADAVTVCAKVLPTIFKDPVIFIDPVTL